MSTPPPPPPPSALTLDGALARLNSQAEDKTQKGRGFERLVKFFLENDPVYKSEYQKVYFYKNWARDNGLSEQDTGIDLVAENRYSELTAIQVKFYETTTISRGDTDSMLAVSGKREFKYRLFVTSTDRWSQHAERVVEDQEKLCNRIGLGELRKSNVVWDLFFDKTVKIKPEKKRPLPHQKEAIKCVLAGLNEADRGKLIMACGTGKTFTSLKIAEKMAKSNGNVLFLVPSLSLLSQALCEWSRNAERSLRNFAVCSDIKVGREREEEDIRAHDLVIAPTTNAEMLAQRLNWRVEDSSDNLNVVFCTYHSIDVVSRAQQQFNAPEFDLVICDEAHRTTGAEKASGAIADKLSYYTKIHDVDYLKASKRLYMTATPRIYSDDSKQKAREKNYAVFSMDKEENYGKELYRLGFAAAIKKGLLSDYKVLVLGISKNMASRIANSEFNGEIKTDDIAKLIGCYNGLAKRFTNTDDTELNEDERYPMRQAVAFANTISTSKKTKEALNRILPKIIDAEIDGNEKLICKADHVDGKMNTLQRSTALNWLREANEDNNDRECRILCNARCLSEGVDVPALDGVIFLNPRKSQIDVVQTVGRVMRKAKGKKYGYVILPILVPEGVEPEEELNNNPKDYKVVWQVLQALRSHDENFKSIVNSIELNKKVPNKIVIDIGSDKDTASSDRKEQDESETTGLLFDKKWSDAILAQFVKKCGDTRYWETWAKDVAKIAQTNIESINNILDDTANIDANKRFEGFVKKLKKNLNPGVSRANAVEMLAQHLITKPVFEALFEDYSFASKNPVSRSMQAVVNILDKYGFKSETEKLDKFYASVKDRASEIDNAEGKQKVMKELYGNFFATAFKKQSQQLGIVYTPIEIVDFILQSADYALQNEFDRKLTDEEVHILDPFTGTGTFMARLLREESPLITTDDLRRKYECELHANEITLLAYYIAAVNIEEVYHYRTKQEYQPFKGIVLTDTFQLGENGGDDLPGVLQENSERANNQQKKKIQVIIGNPPYAVGSNDPHDNIQSQGYTVLDGSIRSTYHSDSSAKLRRSLYDSYIRALRWASNRIADDGVVAFVTNGGFIESHAADGLRKHLLKDFSSVYCMNLRGNTRTSGEKVRREGGKVFGSGSRATVAIILLIKRKGNSKGSLFYHDIGDYLTADEKLKKIADFAHIGNVKWQNINPNKEHDWINQRHPEFLTYQPMGVKQKNAGAYSIFDLYSAGVKTNRDTWVYDFSKKKLAQRIEAMIDYYNNRLEAIRKVSPASGADIFSTEKKRISWSGDLIEKAKKGIVGQYNQSSIRKSIYRPFVKQWLYFDRQFNNSVYLMPAIFPESEVENLVICVQAVGETQDFSALVVDTTPDLHLLSSSQCFPLYRYYTSEDMINETGGRIDNITDTALASYRDKFGDKGICKEDIFYYVYGILHSPHYKQKYAADLRKMLPRIPLVDTKIDFEKFATAGRDLASLHLNYENSPKYDLARNFNSLIEEEHSYRVEKMRFDGPTRKPDKTKIIINEQLTLSGVPLEAYDYKVNGKSPIEWMLDRYQITTDKDSGICRDPNDWDDDPSDIVSLLRRITYVSVESSKIIGNLPELVITDTIPPRGPKPSPPGTLNG